MRNLDNDPSTRYQYPGEGIQVGRGLNEAASSKEFKITINRTNPTVVDKFLWFLTTGSELRPNETRQFSFIKWREE